MLQGTEGKSGLGGLIILFFIFSVFVDLFVWKQVVFGKASGEAKIYFLDVGQGDAELIIFPGNVKVLTDAGPDSKILGQLKNSAISRQIYRHSRYFASPDGSLQRIPLSGRQISFRSFYI